MCEVGLVVVNLERTKRRGAGAGALLLIYSFEVNDFQIHGCFLFMNYNKCVDIFNWLKEEMMMHDDGILCIRK